MNILNMFSSTVRRIDPQIDGQIRNAFIPSSHTFRIDFNFSANLIEIAENLTFTMKEFSIFYSLKGHEAY